MPRSSDAVPVRRRGVLVACALAAGLPLATLAFMAARPARAEPRSPAPPPAARESAPPSLPAPPPPPPLLSPLSAQAMALADERGRSIEVYPPLDPRPSAPLVVFLHATCMDPRPVCDLLGHAGRAGTFLVCPSGNDTCFGAPDWHGPAEVKSAFLTHALEKVEQRWGQYVAHDDTLVGWSRGAFAARDILYADVARGAAPRFTSLVLIAADVTPDPARLRQAGIRRVLFTAGDQDGARLTMARAAVKLTAAGIPARYTSLGPIGHWLPDDFDQRLAPGIAWVRER
jgi:predicted esterase